jgi:hypothetical protein
MAPTRAASPSENGRNVPAQCNPISVPEDDMTASTANSKLWNWLGATGIVFTILFVAKALDDTVGFGLRASRHRLPKPG